MTELGHQSPSEERQRNKGQESGRRKQVIGNVLGLWLYKIRRSSVFCVISGIDLLHN